mgnify:FL=1
MMIIDFWAQLDGWKKNVIVKMQKFIEFLGSILAIAFLMATSIFIMIYEALFDKKQIVQK